MPHVVREHQSQALLGGKMIQAVRHPVLNFGVEHGIDGLFRIFVETSCGSMVFLAAQRLQRHAVSNAENPGRYLRSVAKSIGALPNDHKGIVDDLFDILIAWCESRQETR